MPYSESAGSTAGDTSAIFEVVEIPVSIVLEEQTFELDDIDEEEALCHLEALGFGEDDPCSLLVMALPLGMYRLAIIRRICLTTGTKLLPSSTVTVALT